MDPNSPESTSTMVILITGLITFFTGGTLIKLIEIYLKRKKEQRIEDQGDAKAFRTLLLERLTKLENDAKIYGEEILKLTKENAQLQTENQQMRKEIAWLKEQKS